MTSAETAYLFRHALLRDAAYELQLLGDRRLEASALSILAIVLQDTGRIAEAERTHEQALSLARMVKNRIGEGKALTDPANIYLHTGRIQMAEQAFEQSIGIHREIGSRNWEKPQLGGSCRGQLRESAPGSRPAGTG